MAISETPRWPHSFSHVPEQALDDPSQRGESSGAEIIAHRGYSAVAPENTMASIRRAAEAGAPAVEFDVQVASCGTPMLFHDVHLGRTTNGVGPIHRRTRTQLEALDAGSWFSAEYAGERIPTLEAALEYSVEHFERIYVEVKGYRELDDLDRMIGIAERCGATSPSWFISLDWTILDHLATQLDATSIGYVVDTIDRLDEAVRFHDERGGGLIDLNRKIVLQHPDRVESLRDRGVELAVWTVDETEDADAMRRSGIARITTNEVERMLEWSRSQAAL